MNKILVKRHWLLNKYDLQLEPIILCCVTCTLQSSNVSI